MAKKKNNNQKPEETLNQDDVNVFIDNTSLGQGVTTNKELESFSQMTTGSDSGIPNPLNPEFVSSVENLVFNSSEQSALPINTVEEKPIPVPPALKQIKNLKWKDEPWVERQLELNPQSVQEIGFLSDCFDFSDKAQLHAYNTLINKSRGVMKSIRLLRDEVRYNETQAKFIAYISYIQYKFSNSIFK